MKFVPPLLVLLLLQAMVGPARSESGYRYVSPCPGAELVARETTIILRPEVLPTPGRDAFPAIELEGAVSGSHGGEWLLAGDREILVFRPHHPFAPGETVTVALGDVSFHFTISPKTVDLTQTVEPCGGEARQASHPSAARSSRARSELTLPSSFPIPTVTIHDNPAPGYLLAAPRLAVGGPPHYAAMLDDTGAPAFFRKFPGPASDFKKHESVGLYSYLQGSEGFLVVDEDFVYLDTFASENGYFMLDGHDFQILPNGNVLIGIQDLQTVDMSAIVPGGNPNATVKGFVLQEQDPAHNVVFQWRSWDHFEITDATGIDFTAPFLDYVHWNSFEPDADGNILISCRELNEVTKIDRQTGEIIWRMGGSQNDFTLVGDTQWYTRQHSARRTTTGTVTVFDNGVLSAPQESRALEYALDEVNRIATLVWQFRNDPPLYGNAVGNMQRLPNGNTLISWGPLGVVTEVKSDGTKAFEMTFPDHWTYRTFRFEWDGIAERPELWHEVTPFEVTLHFAKFGDPDVTQYHIYRGSAAEPTALVGSTPGNSFILDVVPTEVLYARVTGADSTGEESAYSNELRIVVPGAVDAPSFAGKGRPIALYQNHPNPFAPATTIAFALADRELVDLSVYDVRGRLVKTLAHDVRRPGVSEVAWDGTDTRGRRAGTGVYFYRLRAGSQEMTKRMTLLW